MGRYTLTWRNKFLPEAQTIETLIDVLAEARQKLVEMQEAGVELEPLGDDYYILHTDDPLVAERFDMEPKEEDGDYDHGGEAGDGS